MKCFCFLFFFGWLFISCNENTIKTNQELCVSYIQPKHAKGFTIDSLHNGNLKLTVKNPWQNAQNVKFEYLLKRKDATVDTIQNSDKNVISYPVERVMCLSTTHLAFIEKLEQQDRIVGVTNPDLVYSPSIQERINQGEIVNIGFDQSLNYEIIVNQKPDLVFIYGVGGEITQFNNKLSELGIKTMLIAEYLEQDPLAKFEWIKLFGLLFDKQEESETIFEEIEDEYSKLMKQIPQNKMAPKILLNLPWNGTWYVPGGKSYMAQMLETCKGEYIWKNDTSRSTIPLSVESVLVKAANAEIWLNPGNSLKREDILLEDSRLTAFVPYNSSKIYNFNKRLNDSGGNDYWESAVVNPHLVLKDLITIIHPEVFPEHQLYYFRKIE